MPPLFYYLGACLMLLSRGFVAKRVCLVLWLSKPAFLSNLTYRGFPYFFLLTIPLWD